MQIKLFHLANSRSQRVIWLLEELQLDYEIIQCTTQNDDLGLKQLKKLDPTAKFPTIQIINNNENFILSETAAIMEYLSHSTKQLESALFSNQEYKNYCYWKNFSEATFIPDLALKQVFHQIVTRTPFPLHLMPLIIKYAFDKAYLNAILQQHMEKIEAHLAQHKWFVGNTFTIADLLLCFPISAYFYKQQSDLKNYLQFPHIAQYLQEIEHRDAFKMAMDKGNWSQSTFKNYWKSAW